VSFDAGAASRKMLVTLVDHSMAPVLVEEAVQADGSVMRLDVLPAARPYEIVFVGRGTLRCDTGATRIVRFSVKRPPSRAAMPPATSNEKVDITIGGTGSTWTGVIEEARGCATEAVGPKTDLTFSSSSGKLTCHGGGIEQVVAFGWSSPTTDLWLKIGNVVSNWSPSGPVDFGRACVGAQGPIEIAALAPGAGLTIPSEIDTGEVKVHPRQSNASSEPRHPVDDPAMSPGVAHPAVRVLCKPGDTLRAVRLVGIEPHEATIIVGAAHVERLDATTGATCAINTSASAHGRSCVLGDAALTCRRLDQGDCRLESGTDPLPLARTEGCVRLTPEYERSAQDKALRQGLVCRRVYQCD
jgi:hypothetical protein